MSPSRPQASHGSWSSTRSAAFATTESSAKVWQRSLLASLLALIALIALSSLPATVAAGTGQGSEPEDEKEVQLVLQFPDRDQVQKFAAVKWREGMTVFDVLQAVQKREEKFAFRHRGQGETLFILEINGVANQGARGNNWVFLINDELGKRSAGVVAVPPGAKVIWRFGQYKNR